METKRIKKVLMCSPSHYSISYSINPWMKVGSADSNLAKNQWENLVCLYKSLGISVGIVDQKKGLPDMVFAADQGIVYENRVIISNFAYRQRKNERLPYLKWYEKNNYSVEFLPKNVYFEGSGESIFFKNFLFVGSGFRTKKEAVPHLEKLLGIEVVPLELIDPYFYHLDVALLPINSKTAFYYKKAFSRQSLAILKNRIANLIPLTQKDAKNFVANSVVTDHCVVVQKGVSLEFKKTLSDLGYKALEVDLSEFIKSGGAAHCLTGVLE